MPRRLVKRNIHLSVKISFTPCRKLDQITKVGQEFNEISLHQVPAPFSNLSLCRIDRFEATHQARRRLGIVSQVFENSVIETSLPPDCFPDRHGGLGVYAPLDS